MPKRMTKEEFIEKARKIHGEKYGYSKVDYKNNSTKVCIVCPKHGEFWQKPNAHLMGHGCPKCKGERLSSLNTKTAEQFIKEARAVHGDKYDYSKVEYVNATTKVCIICPKHGEFKQTPAMHLSGQGCFKCSVERNAERCRLTTEEFIKRAEEIYGDKYDYSKVNYVNRYTKVCIICPKHGEFWQKPNAHLMGHGCPKCSKEEVKEAMFITFDEFCKRANKIHHSKYDYSLAKDLKGLKNKIKIICPTHGVFEQNASDHLNGHGCPKCNCLYKTTEQFIEEAKKVHNGFYSYEKTKYINKLTKVIITCPIHGDFEQMPMNHLKGCKCPHCSFSKLEKKFEKLLIEHNIQYEYQKKFKWLGRQRLDFYIPKYNVAIECQGVQHFTPKEYLGGETSFNENIKRDTKKRMLCQTNGVKLLYYTDLKEFDEFQGNKVFKIGSEILHEIIT